MSEPLPDAPSTARNREPILAELRRLLASSNSVLEIGSGTAQHAVYFARALPQLTWQTSEIAEHLPGIRARLAAEGADNLPPPLELDVRADWPAICADTIFTANTLHIMSADAVRKFFDRLPGVLPPRGQLIVYGPVKIGGRYIGPTNEEFDCWLRERDPLSGIRDLEWLDELARVAGLRRIENNYLPANNQLLVWRREES